MQFLISIELLNTITSINEKINPYLFICKQFFNVLFIKTDSKIFKFIYLQTLRNTCTIQIKKGKERVKQMNKH